MKRGRKPRSVVQSALPTQRADKPGQGKNKPLVVGTGEQGNIKEVSTELVSVLASKFDPDLDAETLAKYLKIKLARDVTCQRIVTVGNRFSSFKVCAECKEVAEMYNPEIWPEGSVVRTMSLV